VARALAEVRVLEGALLVGLVVVEELPQPAARMPIAPRASRDRRRLAARAPRTPSGIPVAIEPKLKNGSSRLSWSFAGQAFGEEEEVGEALEGAAEDVVVLGLVGGCCRVGFDGGRSLP
jgi:hypothetical protein